MSTANLQITIRGLDAKTKQALAKTATQQGTSLNKLALETLRQAAGVDSSEERYGRVAAILDDDPIPADEAKRIDEALQWHKTASLTKQRRDAVEE